MLCYKNKIVNKSLKYLTFFGKVNLPFTLELFKCQKENNVVTLRINYFNTNVFIVNETLSEIIKQII